MKKFGGILLVFLIAIMFVNVFPSSASAASTTKTYTEKFGKGYGKYYSMQQSNGLVLKIYAYYNLDANGATITSASLKAVDVMFPFSVEIGKPKVLVASTKGTAQTASAYGDFKTYIFKAWKFGQVYQTTDRLSVRLKVDKIDTKKKTVTYRVVGSSEK
ncbi:hypothetical protein [Priestia aryabhattai]